MIAAKTLFTFALALGLVSAVPVVEPVSNAAILRRQNGCPDGYYPRIDCNGRDICQVQVSGCPEGYYVNPSDSNQCIVLPC